VQPIRGTLTDGISRRCAGPNFAVNAGMESHLSENKREGSLGEVPLAEVLESCRRHHFTGKIEIRAGEHAGELELNAGVVDVARFDATIGDPALMTMCALHNGQYRISQRLPKLGGDLGEAAAFEGNAKQLPLPQVMRHCEENAMTCIIEVEHDNKCGEIHYRLGEIEKVVLDGERDDDAIVEIVHWTKSRYQVRARPLEPSLHGWPALQSEPSLPFQMIVRRKSQIWQLLVLGALLGTLEYLLIHLYLR
jgi:hypothetical protein